MLYLQSVLLAFLGLLSGVAVDNVTVTIEEPTTVFNSTDSSSLPTMTTCMANSSCSLENKTVNTLSIVGVRKQEDIGNAIRKYKTTPKALCSCDLQHRFCDINCCCDKDCSYENKLVFKTCDEEEEFIPDNEFCKYMQYIYQNHTLYEWEMTQNSLFCIVKSNLPQKYIAQEKQVIKTKRDVMKHKDHSYNWPIVRNGLEEDAFDLNYNYSYGDVVWILKNNTTLQKLELPKNLITSVCNLKAEIRFLIDVKTECIQSTIDEGNSDLNIINFIGNISIISEPYLYSTNFSNKQECPKNICIPLQIKICDVHQKTCTNDTKNIPFLKPTCKYNSKSGQKSCINLVKKVSYTFHHNGTYGIIQSHALITLQNITLDLDNENDEFIQSFEIRFMWNNYTLNYSDFTSGNPGYIYGKPILIADLVLEKNVTKNSTTNATLVHTKEMLIRVFSNYRSNFMVLPLSRRGKCLLSNDSFIVIEFGFNMLTKCAINKEINLPEKNRTANQICQLVQNAILGYWSMQYHNLNNTTVNKTVGKYGNSNVNQLNDWMEILFDKHPQEILNETSGQFKNENMTLLCFNITTAIKIDFFHAREEHNQEKIIATFVEFANFMRFTFKPVNDSLHIDIPIKSEVMFYDITSKQVQKFVEPPSLDIHLPFDFFYPFVKINNESPSVINLNYIVVILCMIVVGGF